MKITSHSPAETLRIGEKISSLLKIGDIICLFGNLGSGKTMLTKGIASGLGIDKDKIVSPSFVLMRRQEAKNGTPFFHFDFYRLKPGREIRDLGLEEYFYAEGITVIEWPEKLMGLLPEKALKIKLSVVSENTRSIKVMEGGERFKRLIQKLK